MLRELRLLVEGKYMREAEFWSITKGTISLPQVSCHAGIYIVNRGRD